MAVEPQDEDRMADEDEILVMKDERLENEAVRTDPVLHDRDDRMRDEALSDEVFARKDLLK